MNHPNIKRKASDYSDYQFNLGFATPKKAVSENVAKDADTKGTIPTMPVTVQEVSSNEDILYTLRHFHLGDPSTIETTEMVGDDYVPALLHAYRDASKVRYDYPLFLSPTESTDAVASQLARPLSEVLRELVESFAPSADAARILKDNLPRLERDLRQTLRQEDAPVVALPLLTEAGQKLQQELGLNAENNARLQADFDKLLKAIPPNSQILGYGDYAAIHLLNHAVRSRILPRRAHFQEKIKQLLLGLKTLLDVDWRKSDDSIEPKMALESVGTAGSRFDPVLLSDVMDHSRGSVILSTERRERILKVVQILEDYLQFDDPILVRFVQLGNIKSAWLENTPGLEAVSDSEPCAKATELFDQQASKLARVFGAARIAQLEIDGIYDPNIHEPWFANFAWEAFSKEEMLLLPVVIAQESPSRIAGREAGVGMRSLSRLLSSGRPVHILLRVQAHNNPHAADEEDPFLNFRLELGYFGISHRQAVVSQSSASRHGHLLEQYLSALDATRTSLYIFNTGGIQHSAHGINAWLIAGAALESRAHPFFNINPEAGDSFADRMNFIGNPQPETDWPFHSFQFQNDKKEIITTELAFTFADYALLVPRLRQHFRLVPLGFDSQDLVPVDLFISDCQKDNCRRVPFIWAVNEQGELRKLVASRALMFACQDRLNYWHTLQEMAGIHNKYVNMAVQKTIQELEAEAKAEREHLQAEHTEQLEKVRRETAGEVMQRLTDVLLGMDFTTASPNFRTKTSTAASTKTSAEPVTEAESAPETDATAQEAEPEEVTFDDPWIDSELCTSCNDCMKVNTVLFVYNENKQAILGDLSTGTYAQLVEAAELCPARCIHPGKPSNPNEPGLEELIERAKPFN